VSVHEPTLPHVTARDLLRRGRVSPRQLLHALPKGHVTLQLARQALEELAAAGEAYPGRMGWFLPGPGLKAGEAPLVTE
jgi:hypothetical protein